MQIFVLLWVFLQNVVVEFGGELMYIYYKKVEIPELHYTYSPGKRIIISFYDLLFFIYLF